MIREELNDMIETVKAKTNFIEGDLLNIVVNHNDLWIHISTRLSRTSDIDNLLNKIQSILTSNEDLDIYGCPFHAENVIIVKNVVNHIKTNLNINVKRESKYVYVVILNTKNSGIEYIVKNASDIVTIKIVSKIIQKFRKDFINA
ncbi:hypothetical protein BDFB_013612 [Asbolus verrucosus]|uniref:Uncharacterized protein n=1 Tax=Asbolus verrucosus TaxID=1661398 RepID=A0A482W878_ASBVE|nr:hypothetical protein BDFB_013612 [Asbolus verrucosus]